MDLEELEKYAAECVACDLHTGRKKAVFAKGNPEAGIMIVGMVPADDENEVGIPFVGRAGKLLDQILSDAGLSQDDVYITNLVKCYLKAGLPLKETWVDACFPYLITQIGLIRPKVIVTLGKDSTFTLLGLDNKLTLGRVRGEIFNFNDIIRVIPTYHPSYLLRGGGKDHKSYLDVVDNFKTAYKITLDN